MPASSLYLLKIQTALRYLLVILYLLSIACGSPDPLPPPCIEAKPDTGEKDHWGNFDYATCNKSGCHTDWIGGWVYNNPKAEELVQGATVTVTNSDNTVVEAVTRADGFFLLTGGYASVSAVIPLADNPVSEVRAVNNIIVPPFTPCIGKCPGIECAKKPHLETDCQSSGCHGAVESHLYVPLEGTTVMPCENLPEPGPRVHDAFNFDSPACQPCHDNSYVGGFVYDGITSDTAVDRATVTLTSFTGYTISAVSGPEGLIYFENGIFAPYVACVNKCGNKVCSFPESHPTAENCGICHDPTNRIHVP